MAQGGRLGGRYRLDERIGAGGMGEVWRGTDEVLGRAVAVKMVLPTLLGDPDFVRRFLVEARAMASVNHPGVVSIHDYGSDATGAFLVMEFVAGEPLSRTLGRVGRLTPTATMQVVTQAARALQAVHDNGIVHRDVKPANLLIRADGSVMLTDFGVARGTGTALTSTGAMLGTPSYLAPEQVLGEPATPRSDVYALGLVAYECLTGRRPFVADSPYAVAMKRVREPPPPLGDDVPAPVRTVVERALAADPARRWRSAADLAAVAHEAELGVGPTVVVGLDAPTEFQAEPPSRPRAAPDVAEPAKGAPWLGRGAAPDVAEPAKAVRAGWRWVLAAVAALVLGVTATGAVLWQRGGTAGGAVQNEPDTRAAPEGFAACGSALCPSESMCWGGLTLVGGVAKDARSIDCAQPHYWETFAAGHLPANAVYGPQEKLIERPEVASACAASVLADRSVDPTRTREWQREPWPVRIGDNAWIFHCLAAPPEGGERTGSEFRVG